MTPKAEPQSEEVTLLWRIGAICCCCLVVIVLMIIANPLAMSKLLGGNLRNWHEVNFLLISNWLMIDEVDMCCNIGSTLIRPVDSGFLDEGSSIHFFLQVIRVLSLLDHPVSIWCYFVSRVMQRHPGEVWSHIWVFPKIGKHPKMDGL